MIETKSAFISKIDDNTIKVVFKPNAFLRDAEYQTYLDHYEKLLGMRTGFKFLVIVQEGFKLENRYLKFFKKSYNTDFKVAEAYLVLNPSAKMFFSLGTKVVKRKYPIKLFDTEKEALTWLKSI